MISEIDFTEHEMFSFDFFGGNIVWNLMAHISYTNAHVGLIFIWSSHMLGIDFSREQLFVIFWLIFWNSWMLTVLRTEYHWVPRFKDWLVFVELQRNLYFLYVLLYKQSILTVGLISDWMREWRRFSNDLIFFVAFHHLFCFVP